MEKKLCFVMEMLKKEILTPRLKKNEKETLARTQTYLHISNAKEPIIFIELIMKILITLKVQAL